MQPPLEEKGMTLDDEVDAFSLETASATGRCPAGRDTVVRHQCHRPQTVATAIPVPGWPGLGAYPAFVRTTTMCGEFPTIQDADL